MVLNCTIVTTREGETVFTKMYPNLNLDQKQSVFSNLDLFLGTGMTRREKQTFKLDSSLILKRQYVQYFSDIFISGKNVVIFAETSQYFC